MTTTDELELELANTQRELAELREQVSNGSHHAGRRLSLSEILEAHLAAMTKPSGPHSSVRLTRNAKGDTQVEVLVSAVPGSAIATPADASAEAARVYDALRLVYPMADEPTRASRGPNGGGTT